MGWQFWKKTNASAGENVAAVTKLSRPKELPAAVGRELVVRFKQDPDWVWNLRCVMKPVEGEKHKFKVRIFSPRTISEKKIAVRDFHSLNDHPDVILYEAWFDKRNNDVRVEDHTKPKPTPRAA
jgi:hypothetical protein